MIDILSIVFIQFLTHFIWNTFVFMENWLEPKSGPTYVGPDVGFSLFASSSILFLLNIAKTNF